MLVGACSVMRGSNYYDVMGYVILHFQQRDDGVWIWQENPCPVAEDIHDGLGVNEYEFQSLQSLITHVW